ncbi:BON domain-containing protein [Granulosicoccaceae sp. 1_MG-2023]|nr:BON domain-containing protein [Granulosicoccaceae sp. 1_MG-2023]
MRKSLLPLMALVFSVTLCLAAYSGAGTTQPKARPAANGPSGLAEKSEAFIDDAILAARVKTRLINQAGLAAFDIDVHAEQGAIRLQGEVADVTAKALAGRLARHTDGVRSVDNALSPVTGAKRSP